MMVEKTPKLDIFTYVALIIGIVVVGFPILYALIAATLPIEDVSKVPMSMVPGDQLFHNLSEAWNRGHLGTQLFNSFVMASGITIGKIIVSLFGAFSIVYFDYRLRTVAFAAVFCTLMLPVEVRILPTYEMAANLFGPLQSVWDMLGLNGIVSWFAGHDIEVSLEFSLLDSYAGLILPLTASATCTFLFRQFFLTIPDLRSGKDGWRIADDLLLEDSGSAVQNQHRSIGGYRVCLRLEPVSLAATYYD